MVSKVINLALRALEFFWCLLIIALVGNMIAEASNGNPSVVNFAIFCGIFGMLTLFYLIPATFNESFSFHPLLMVGLDFLNTLFFFACGVALAVQLGVHSCGSNSYTSTNSITDGTGGGNQGKRCHEAQATDAFLWFGFAAFAASTVLSALQGRGAGGGGRTGGMRRSGPSKSPT
ncbi:MAG: hypothetical protein M1828_007480 [Chrysothrix sp. TS-e1954]|nr:MAG: hypothetical protein M1828_007480 [Chrysothrix sp. TS-e1954]